MPFQKQTHDNTQLGQLVVTAIQNHGAEIGVNVYTVVPSVIVVISLLYCLFLTSKRKGVNGCFQEESAKKIDVSRTDQESSGTMGFYTRQSGAVMNKEQQFTRISIHQKTPRI